MDLHLDPDGPHSDDSIRHVANGLAECVRVLNHATLPPREVESPATVHYVTGSLHSAAVRLDQLIRQLRDQLVRLYDEGRIGDAVDTRAPGYQTAATLLELEDAQARAVALAEPLRRAHNASSGLYLREDNET